MLTSACKPKYEIIPEGAKQISREDRTEQREDGISVKLREYSFLLGKDTFVCESRQFSDASSAARAAQKSIAERPQEEEKSTRAQFARSGRSLWLRIDNRLVWCMLATQTRDGVAAALAPVRASFLKQFREAS